MRESMRMNTKLHLDGNLILAHISKSDLHKFSTGNRDLYSTNKYLWHSATERQRSVHFDQMDHGEVTRYNVCTLINKMPTRAESHQHQEKLDECAGKHERKKMFCRAFYMFEFCFKPEMFPLRRPECFMSM
jgi:hypothetical protein